MALPPTTNSRQIPEKAALDANNKQAYQGNQFIYPVAATVVGTSEVALYYIVNPSSNAAVPAASATPIPAQTIFISLKKFQCLTSGQTVTFKFYSNPLSVTAGTAVTPVNRRLANLTTSIATITLSPTWTVAGTPFETMFATNTVPDTDNAMLIIDPGQSVMITATASAASTSTSGKIIAYEL